MYEPQSVVSLDEDSYVSVSKSLVDNMRSSGAAVPLKDRHPFLTRELKLPIAKSRSTRTLLADFRARGATIQRAAVKKSQSKKDTECAAEETFAILYCNYSTESSKTSFCVYPTILIMESTGAQDIPLGYFLEKYCFRPEYKCQDEKCKSPLLQHVRKFCHSNGSVQITLKQQTSQVKFPSDQIITWTFCSSCKTNSAFAALADEPVSFAKFLQLRICGHEYLRVPPDEMPKGCHHRLFLDRIQYFAYNNLVAAVEYFPITVRDIVFPAPRILFRIEAPSLFSLREELKKITIRGFEVLSQVLEKLCVLKDELSQTPYAAMSVEYMVWEERDRTEFKKRVNQMQVELCEHPEGLEKFHIQDNLFHLNKKVALFVQSWNSRLQDLTSKKKEEKSLSKNPSVVSLGTRSSSNMLDSPAPFDSTATSDSLAAEDVFIQSINSNRSDGEIQETVDAVQEITLHETTENPPQVPYLPTSSLSHPLAPSPSISSLSSLNAAVGNSTFFMGSDYGEETPTNDGSTEKTDDVLDGLLKKGNEAIAPASGAPKAPFKRNESQKPSLKSIISNLVSGSSYLEIESPFAPNEHYLLNINNRLPVLVKDDDPGSIIAYALSSADYDKHLVELMKAKPPTPRFRSSETQATGVSKSESETSGHVVVNSGSAVFTKSSSSSSEPQTGPSSHIEVQFSDASTKFSCICYFAENFRELRAETIELSAQPPLPSTSVVIEEMFVRSLSVGVEWKASGGKSGSLFRKTVDDRFIIKELKSQELTSFLSIGNVYFEYLEHSKRNARPTVLAKIFGVYKITYNNTVTNATVSKKLMVMENLFYGRNISQKFDLKGSERNRLADTNSVDPEKTEVVLLDENLTRMIRDSPLYVRPQSKKRLQVALENDSLFLTAHEILDYSLLVGVDEDKKELVVGVIDFIRTFTWDKKVESLVKQIPKMADRTKPTPTIVKPESYRGRFIQKMNHYLMPVPLVGFKSDADSQTATDFHF